MEAEARKKRQEDPAPAAGEEGKRTAPRSGLPPRADRKKAQRADVFQIAEEDDEGPAAVPAQ